MKNKNQKSWKLTVKVWIFNKITGLQLAILLKYETSLGHLKTKPHQQKHEITP